MSRLEVVVLVTAVLMLAFAIEVVRRRRLSESYALLWITVALAGLVVGLARPLVDRVSQSVGIVYGTSLVFAVAILFLMVVCVNLSMHVSRLEQQVEKLAQEVAFLRGPLQPDPDAITKADPPTSEGADPPT